MGAERGRFLLLGSGEFEPWAAEAERFALSGAAGDGSVAVLATASGREGDSVFERWIGMGLASLRVARHRRAPCPCARAYRCTRREHGKATRRREHGVLQRREPEIPRTDVERDPAVGWRAAPARPRWRLWRLQRRRDDRGRCRHALSLRERAWTAPHDGSRSSLGRAVGLVDPLAARSRAAAAAAGRAFSRSRRAHRDSDRR